jgi:hypothetical protein
MLQAFTVFADVNHEYFSIWRDVFGIHNLTFFVVGRSERSAFLEREFARVDNASWWV